MSAIFIPPPGAMQFEKTTPNLYFPDKQDVYWVMPPQPGPSAGLTGCRCAFVYPIIIEALTPANRAFAMRFPNAGWCACACVGKLVE
jgi:hypothetical protein